MGELLIFRTPRESDKPIEPLFGDSILQIAIDRIGSLRYDFIKSINWELWALAATGGLGTLILKEGIISSNITETAIGGMAFGSFVRSIIKK